MVLSCFRPIATITDACTKQIHCIVHSLGQVFPFVPVQPVLDLHLQDTLDVLLSHCITVLIGYADTLHGVVKALQAQTAVCCRTVGVKHGDVTALNSYALRNRLVLLACFRELVCLIVALLACIEPTQDGGLLVADLRVSLSAIVSPYDYSLNIKVRSSERVIPFVARLPRGIDVVQRTTVWQLVLV